MSITREEKLLDAVAGEGASGITPITREEQFLAYAAGESDTKPAPITRREMFLDKLEPGGGGATPSLQMKAVTINANGNTVIRPDGGFDGLLFASVTVDVPSTGGDDIIPLIRRHGGEFPYAAVSAAGSIGSYAFAAMQFLNNDITLPENLTYIGQFAFASSEITSVVIPNSVATIAYCAFSACPNLISAKLPNNDNIYLESDIFSSCGNLQTVGLPNNMTTIPWGMFNGCTQLKEIKLPDSVIEIQGNAFGSSGLESVTIPDSASIQDTAFGYCNNLSKVLIPNGVQFISDNAFEGSPNVVIYCYTDSYAEQYALSRNIPVAYLDTVTDMTIVTLPNKTIYPLNGILNLDGLSLNITLENGVQKVVTAGYTIDEYDFSTGGTKTITVRYGDITDTFEVFVDETLIEYPESQHPYPDGINETWYYTHNTDADALAITFSPETYTEENCDWIYIYNADGSYQGQYSGYALAGQTIVTTGNSFSINFTSDGSMNGYGFSITNIEAVKTPDFVVSDGVLTQYSGTGGDIVIPDTVHTIADNVFYNRTDITSVLIPTSVTTIYGQVFDSCTGITSINIPDSVTEIRVYAFANNPNLKHAILPASFTTDIIGKPFSGCNNLKYIVLRGDAISSLHPDMIIGETPLADHNGTIYIEPISADVDVNSLVEQYKADPNWSVYADIIKPITELNEEE